jgi:hypothetical protein
MTIAHLSRVMGATDETDIHYDEATGEAVICPARGAETDWYRNLQAGPPIQMQLGRDSYVPEHRFLSDDEAFEVGVGFRRDHPHRLRLLGTVRGWGDLEDDGAVRQFVRAQPPVRGTPAGGRDRHKLTPSRRMRPRHPSGPEASARDSDAILGTRRSAGDDLRRAWCD